MSIIINKKNARLLSGTFGLERETLRVTADGGMAQSPHPFQDDANIVKDFCENQAEINTGVHNTAQGAIGELSRHSERLTAELNKRGEKLRLYSNPPIIKNADEIPIAVYGGNLQYKHNYRLYLAEKYGKYKMTLSGIHVNYSLSEEMLRYNLPNSSRGDFVSFKNQAYLRLAQGLLEYGWLINLLLSASPVCDGSYFNPGRAGETVFTKYASLRCGKEGYWNTFTPILFYENIMSYAGSIQRYINSGALAGVSELYYPIRLKPKGANHLNNLAQNGVNHIELRNIDINPFSPVGLDVRDLQFLELLILWIYSNYKDKLLYNDQIRAIKNLKNGALYDIDSTLIYGKETLREAGIRVLGNIQAFYGETEIIAYQTKKLTESDARYAEKVCDLMRKNSSDYSFEPPERSV